MTYEDFMNENATVKRGHAYYVDLPKTNQRNVQYGERICVCISNDVGNSHSDIAIMVPCTTQVKKDMPTHVEIILEKKSTVLCEQILTVNQSSVGREVRTLSDQEMMNIDRAIVCSISLNVKPAEIKLDVPPNIVYEEDTDLERATKRMESIRAAADILNEAIRSYKQTEDGITIQIGDKDASGTIGDSGMQQIKEIALREVSSLVEADRKLLEVAMGIKAGAEKVEFKRAVDSMVQSTKPAAKKKRVVLDMDYVMSQLETGKTQKQIADELGIAQSNLSMRIKQHKGEQDRIAKLDEGKVHALHNAGWNTKSIAEEVNVPKEVIVNVLKEEK
jgi:mRNA-degrading endonuclease toxin of MazEF toxin-antitoxin module